MTDRQEEERNCAYCGNLLEPDEGHPSKLYKAELCDACYEREKEMPDMNAEFDNLEDLER